MTVIIFRIWLFTNEWPAGGDVLGWISRAYLLESDFKWLYTWRPSSFGFSQGIDSMDFFMMIIYSVCRDAGATVKILMFSSFLTAGFTMYAFAYHYTSRHMAALSASLIYCLNQWIFSQFTEGHLHIIFSYALAPLLFLLMDRALKKQSFKNIIAVALALGVFATGFHPQSIVIYGIFLAIFTAFFVIKSVKFKNFHIKPMNILKTGTLLGVTLALVSAFWIIPFLFNVRAPYYSATYSYPLEDAVQSSYKNTIDAFTMRAGESWGYTTAVNLYSGSGVPFVPLNILLLLVFIPAFCTVFIRRDRYTLFFAFAAIISTAIATGPHPPFGDIFTWAWFNIPHFSVFRAANRMAMIIAFSNAFFVSVLVDMLVTYIQKKKYAEKQVFLKAKIETPTIRVHESYISLKVAHSINRTVKILHKFLHYLSYLLLILVFLSGFLSCFYFFSQGLQVYTPPESYIEPYDWIAQQAGDYKIITTTNSPSEWENKSIQESDFAFSGMKTSLGWGHDIGYDSSFLHGRPVLQDGGWSTPARHYVDYMRFRLARKELTENMLEMIGPFNYKYVVLPEYLSNNTRNFFLQQEGYDVVYNQSSIILENKYYTPGVFATGEYAYVMGGLQSFSALCKIDTFNLNETGLIFAHQTDETSFSADLFSNSDALILVNTDLVDATMLSLRDEANFIIAANYGVSSQNYSRNWVTATSWRSVGGFVWGGDTLTTSGNTSIKIPFKTDSNGNYDVWLRIAFVDNRGNLTVLIDGTPIGEIKPRSRFWSRLMWVNINSLDLEKGEHTITLANDGTGYNDIDTIAIVKPNLFQSRMNDLIETLQRFSGRIIYVLEAENTFTFDPPENWYTNLISFEDYVFHNISPTANISPEGNASASSVGVWGTISLEADGANDGRKNTRWASTPYEMPQWLQIEWETPQELTGAHILFEDAYAENYTIQTWNGEEWVNQVNVTGNVMIDRVHMFPESVVTKKLRLYVTSAPAYGLVSVWEFEAYTIPWLSTRLSIPREDQYMFAIRLVKGLNQGIPQLRINNTNVTVRHLNSNAEAEWYEAGPVYLDASDHLIEIRASERIEFDQLIIYSLENGEQLVDLGDFGLHAEELGMNVSPNGTISASSVGVWDNIGLDANRANDQNLETRWASKPHESMPQWLQIEWETPQELTGAHILFEDAYAENYTIQTWNGVDWVNQVNVTGNVILDRVHMFSEPVKTTKLRLYITSVTALYDLVSIWEFKAYAEPTVSRSILIPEDGFYRADFRLAFGPQFGTVTLKVNDETIDISCNSPDAKIIHYEAGPFYLHSGEQTVTISATGEAYFSDMVMTLNDEGDFGFLDDLFEAKPGPKVSYEKINPTKYKAHVENSNEPFLLIFSESYHPRWKAYVDGEEISPIPMYSLVNGYYINKTGDFDVTIYFTGQSYADLGIRISVVTLIIVVPVMIIPSKKLKQWGKYIKQKVLR